MLSSQQGKLDSEGLRTPAHRLNNIDIVRLRDSNTCPVTVGFFRELSAAPNSGGVDWQ
jgi:hypothetical protein